jgi:DNA-binding XRE family transcriptional regulator
MTITEHKRVEYRKLRDDFGESRAQAAREAGISYNTAVRLDRGIEVLRHRTYPNKHTALRSQVVDCIPELDHA